MNPEEYVHMFAESVNTEGPVCKGRYFAEMYAPHTWNAGVLFSELSEMVIALPIMCDEDTRSALRSTHVALWKMVGNVTEGTHLLARDLMNTPLKPTSELQEMYWRWDAIGQLGLALMSTAIADLRVSMVGEILDLTASRVNQATQIAGSPET